MKNIKTAIGWEPLPKPLKLALEMGFIVGVVVISILVLGEITTATTEPSQSSGAILTPSPGAERPDSAGRWNLYVNDDYGYSIEYPSGWIVDRQIPGGVVLQTFRGAFPQSEKDISISIVAKKNTARLSLDQFIAQDSENAIVDRKTKVRILATDLQTIRVSYAGEVGAGMPAVYFSSARNLFVCRVYYGSEAREQALELLDRMLSTFDLR